MSIFIERNKLKDLLELECLYGDWEILIEDVDAEFSLLDSRKIRINGMEDADTDQIVHWAYTFASCSRGVEPIVELSPVQPKLVLDSKIMKGIARAAMPRLAERDLDILVNEYLDVFGGLGLPATEIDAFVDFCQRSDF